MYCGSNDYIRFLIPRPPQIKDTNREDYHIDDAPPIIGPIRRGFDPPEPHALNELFPATFVVAKARLLKPIMIVAGGENRHFVPFAGERLRDVKGRS